MRWGNAADAFVNYGCVDKLSAIVRETAEHYHGSNAVCGNLETSFNDLVTVRGEKITEGKKIKKLIKNIEELQNYEKFHPAFKPFFDQIKNAFENFREGDPLNFIPATKLLLQHGRVQQAITLMQEGIITLFMHRHQGDWKSRDFREHCASLITAKIREHRKDSYPKNDRRANEEKYKEFDERLKSDSLLEDIYTLYDQISMLRNNINHGGYVIDNSPCSALIIKNANEYCTELENILKNNAILPPEQK